MELSAVVTPLSSCYITTVDDDSSVLIFFFPIPNQLDFLCFFLFHPFAPPAVSTFGILFMNKVL